MSEVPSNKATTALPPEELRQVFDGLCDRFRAELASKIADTLDAYPVEVVAAMFVSLAAGLNAVMIVSHYDSADAKEVTDFVSTAAKSFGEMLTDNIAEEFSKKETA